MRFKEYLNENLKNKVNSLTPSEKFSVINNFLGIRIASGVRYFESDPDKGTDRFFKFASKVNQKTLEKAVDHMIDQRSKVIKKPFRS